MLARTLSCCTSHETNSNITTTDSPISYMCNAITSTGNINTANAPTSAIAANVRQRNGVDTVYEILSRNNSDISFH